jgi:hypothetical protein
MLYNGGWTRTNHQNTFPKLKKVFPDSTAPVPSTVCSSDPATCQFGKRGSIAAIAETRAYVKNHLSNSTFGYLTQFSIMTCVLQFTSLWMLTLKDTSWLSFFTYVHGATMVIMAFLFPMITQLNSYFPGTPGSRYTAFASVGLKFRFTQDVGDNRFCHPRPEWRNL